MVARYFGLIPAAGKGERFGAALPKQYQGLRGRTVLNHSVDALLVDTPLSRVYVVHADRDQQCAEIVGSGYRIATLSCGGATRAKSVRNALAALRGELNEDDWVLVHDAVRPCLTHDALVRLLREVGDDPVGGLLAVPIADTLKRDDGNSRVAATEPRAGLWQAQTPQMFRYGVLFDAYRSDRALDATDEAQAVEMLGKRPLLVQGSASNIKITWPADLALAESLLKSAETRGMPDATKARMPAENAVMAGNGAQR